VYLASLESGTTRRLFRSDTNALFTPPGDILFVREGTLFAQRYDVTRSEIVGEPTPVVEQVSWTIGPWNLGAFSASATGALTYRRGGSSRTQLSCAVDRSGRDGRRSGSTRSTRRLSSHRTRSRVAFMRRPAIGRRHLTMDLARHTLSRFTFDPASEILPTLVSRWPDDRLRIDAGRRTRKKR
jgi:hypothetical protein